MTDPLIERARSGDEPALRELYETYRGRVLRLAYALMGDPAEAEDVMQDVMTYALTHLNAYDEARAAFGTWLHMITVSRCRDRARREKLRMGRLGAWLRREERAEPDPSERIAALDASSTLVRGLAGLTPTQREALALRHLEELSFEEMGQILGVPMRTAQARVNSATGALRRALADTPHAPVPAQPQLEVKSG